MTLRLPKLLDDGCVLQAGVDIDQHPGLNRMLVWIIKAGTGAVAVGCCHRFIQAKKSESSRILLKLFD